MIVATAGHVDHGKTSLVRALTGIDTDRLPEEKARGLSIDLGFAYLPVEGREPIAFVDVPGHERFVRNMIAGVHTVDLALLVVAADDGPMPQTVEHVAILQALGARRAIVALTKVDRVDEVRQQSVRAEITQLLSATRFADAPVFPVATPLGQGIACLGDALRDAAADARTRHDSGMFRMHVDRVFVLQGIGLVATGCAVAGRIDTGAEVWVSRSQRGARVRSLRVSDREAGVARAGERCALALAGLSRTELERGDVLTGIAGLEPTRLIDVKMEPIALADVRTDVRTDMRAQARASTVTVRSRHAVLVCLGTQAVTGTLTLLEPNAPPGVPGHARSSASPDASAGASLAERPGSPSLARLALEHPISAFLGERMLLRDLGSQTLMAAATVLDPLPATRRAERASQRQRLRSLAESVGAVCEEASPSTPGAYASALAHHLNALLSLPGHVLDLDWFARVTGTSADDIDAALALTSCERFRDPGRTGARMGSMAASLATSLATRDAAVDALGSLIDRWHADHPDQLGLRASQGPRMLRDWAPALVGLAQQRLLDAGTLVRSGPFLRRAGHRPQLSKSDALMWQTLAPALEGEGGRPPRVHELAQRFALAPTDIEACLQRATDAGLVYRVARNRFFLPDALVALAQLAHTLAHESPQGRFDAATYRDRSGLGRNLTIEVLEFLDAAGITRRAGDGRTAIGPPQSLMLSAKGAD